MKKQWPTTGERRKKARILYGVLNTDPMGGRSDPTWKPVLDSWFVQVTVVPFVVSETEATLLYDLEGLYVKDLLDRFNHGQSLRAIVDDLTLKIFSVEDPQLKHKTLVAHCGKATNTQ